jgi:hypothetical protein
MTGQPEEIAGRAALVVQRDALPPARIGRSSRPAGALGPEELALAIVALAQLALGAWAPALIVAVVAAAKIWRRLPRVERFRRCAVCGCVRADDYQRSGLGSGTSVCHGTVASFVEGGDPWCVLLRTMSQ